MREGRALEAHYFPDRAGVTSPARPQHGYRQCWGCNDRPVNMPAHLWWGRRVFEARAARICVVTTDRGTFTCLGDERLVRRMDFPETVGDSDSEAKRPRVAFQTFVVACPDWSGRALLLLRFASLKWLLSASLSSCENDSSERAELKKGGTAGTFLCLFEIRR